MQWIQSATGETGPDHLFGQPDRVELPPPYHPVLATRQVRHPPVKDLRVEFPLDSNGKSTAVFHATEVDRRKRTCGAQFVPIL
jgi:hypothetical protein